MTSATLAYLQGQEAHYRRLATTAGRPEYARHMLAMAEEYAQRVAELERAGNGRHAVMMQMSRHQGSPPAKNISGN